MFLLPMYVMSSDFLSNRRHFSRLKQNFKPILMYYVLWCHYFKTASLTHASDIYIVSSKQTLMKTLAIHLRTEQTIHISQ